MLHIKRRDILIRRVCKSLSVPFEVPAQEAVCEMFEIMHPAVHVAHSSLEFKMLVHTQPMAKPGCTELLHSQYFMLIVCFMKIFRDGTLYVQRTDMGCLIVRQINQSDQVNLSDAFMMSPDRLMIHLMSKCCTSLLWCSCQETGTHPCILA